MKPRIAALAPRVAARDDREEARARGLDQRLDHWTAVRNGLMNAHADFFPQLPAIARMLPDELDQMKLFELIQIIPGPTRAALKWGKFADYRISDPKIMGFLRNNSIFTFGKADRARTSATFRDILDAMWLFNAKFERARSKFKVIKGQESGEAPKPSRRFDDRLLAQRFGRSCGGAFVCGHSSGIAPVAPSHWRARRRGSRSPAGRRTALT